MTRDAIRALIADDAYAMTFQTMGQYRSALLAALAAPVAGPDRNFMVEAEPAAPPDDLLDLRDRVMAWKEAREYYKAAPTDDAKEFKRRQLAERHAQTDVLCWLPDEPAALPASSPAAPVAQPEKP